MYSLKAFNHYFYEDIPGRSNIYGYYEQFPKGLKWFPHYYNFFVHLWNGLVVYRYPKCCVINFVKLFLLNVLPGRYMLLNFPGYRILNPKPEYVKCFSCLTKQLRALQDKEATVATFGEP